MLSVCLSVLVVWFVLICVALCFIRKVRLKDSGFPLHFVRRDKVMEVLFCVFVFGFEC